MGTSKGAFVPTSPLPPNASLEHLKNQAKLVRDLIRAGDDGALSMIDEFHPKLSSADVVGDERKVFKLAHAQLIVARMYRSVSWAKLRSRLGVVKDLSFTPAAERKGYVDFEESFVELACLNFAENGPNPHDRVGRAHELLAADPMLAVGSLEVAATVGDHRSVAELLEQDPGIVNAPCGPNQWPPLLYATYSRIHSPNTHWSAIETVRVLLASGADPNAGFLWRGLVPPFTALTGALGNSGGGHPNMNDRFEIARLLLEAGADPNDGQGLYNNGIGGNNHDDPRHLELLLEFGLGSQQNGPWYERFGDQLGDPAESLYHELEAACLRNRPRHLEVLISLGLELDRPVGRSRKTPGRLAAEHGHEEILELLTQAGIHIELSPMAQLLGAIRSADAASVHKALVATAELADGLKREHPDVLKSVPAGGQETLKLLLDIGFDINARTGGNGTTPLHSAAQDNDVARATMLINHGADPNLPDNFHQSTPWGWANHFHHLDVAAFLFPLTTHDGA